MDKFDVNKEIEFLISNGVYCQRELFNRLYPIYNGHYSILREKIAKAKNK